MTADPGTYDATPADLALEREDAADEAKVQAWRESKADDYLRPGEYAMARSARHAMDATFAALHGSTPDPLDAITDAKDWSARMRARMSMTDAVLSLRMAELNGLHVDDDEWHRLMGIVRDRADRALGVTA